MSDHLTSSKTTIQHHQRYTRYRQQFAAVRITTLGIIGHSKIIRPFHQSGVIDKIHGTYRKHPIASSRLTILTRRIRSSLHSSNYTRIPTRRVKLAVLKPLQRLSRITCLHFTSICHSFSSLTSFRRRVTLLGTDHRRSKNNTGRMPVSVARKRGQPLTAIIRGRNV